MRATTGPTDRVVVVGAGFGGLSAAAHLTAAGREVVVVDAGAKPGGLAGTLQLDGYSFDTGPTVLTMPEVVAETLAVLGERIEDWLELHRLDPIYRASFADGEQLDVCADAERTAEQIAAFAGSAEAAGYRRLVRWLQALYDVQMRHFIDRNIDSPLGLLRPSLVRLAALGGFGRLDHAVGRFLTDERVRRLFSFQSLYAGVAPQRALALYAVIAYMDTVGGVVFPRGGIHAVAAALAGAAVKHGAQLRAETRVVQIETADGRARAVRTADGDRIEADAVVLATDLPTAQRILLNRRPRRLRLAPSCVVLHAGLDRDYPSDAHHNILFGRAWRGTFTELIRDRTPMSDPSLLLTHPTRTDPTLAPDRRHTYYVLAPAPNLEADLDWSVLAPRYRDELLATVAARGHPGFAESIEVGRLVTPADWGAAGLTGGTPFAAAHTLTQTGPFRPRNLVPGLDNVVLAGAWTHPGVGVPTTLISGRLAAERITGRIRSLR